MSKMMLKMLAEMAGITPEEITRSIEHFRTVAIQGVGMLERIDERLGRIEIHLGIEPLETGAIENASQLERQE